MVKVPKRIQRGVAQDEQMMVSGDVGEDFVYDLSHLEEPPFLFTHPRHSITAIHSGKGVEVAFLSYYKRAESPRVRQIRRLSS